jgi:hypothetical protein
MPPTGPGISNLPPGWRLLGVDSDGKLIFIDAAVGNDPVVKKSSTNQQSQATTPTTSQPNRPSGAAIRSEHLAVATRSVFCPGSGDDGCSGEWEWRLRGVVLKKLKVRYIGFGVEKVPVFGEKLKLRWFYEKSGNLLFTLGEGTGSPGAFLLSMASKHVEKVADGVECDSWRNVVGYEMDGPAYLTSLSRS